MPHTLYDLLIYALTSLGLFALVASGYLARRRIFRSKTKIHKAAHVFDFEGDSLIDASPNARHALPATAFQDDSYPYLMTRLAQTFPTLQEDFAEARRSDGSVILTQVLDTGPTQAQIISNGSKARVVVEGLAAPFADRKLVSLAEYQKREDELTRLRSIVNVAPMPIWCESATGDLN